VSHFDDGSLYSYVAGEGGEGVLNIGWLDASHEYHRGTVPPEFVGSLKDLCARGTYRTRGWHRCNLCSNGAPYPVAVDGGPAVRYQVGDAEIRVHGRGGIVYAAPTMVIHYVEEHGYRPPDVFIAAVLES
jgi:hypothetical protein